MSVWSKRWLSLFVVGVLIAGCAGSGSQGGDNKGSQTQQPTGQQQAPADAGKPKYGGELVIIQGAAPKTLHSIIDPGGPGITILEATEESLYTADAKGNLIPLLAESLPEVPDPLTWIIKIKKGVKFHSGDELTAEDVQFTLERLYKPDSQATFRSVYQPMIQDVQVVDNYTVKILLKQPWPIFPSFLRSIHTKVVNKSFVLAAGADYGVSKWDGTGPFKISEWVKDSHVTVVRNPNYHQEGKPYLDKITFKLIPEPAAQVANLETGKAHINIDPSFSDLEKFKNSQDFQVIANPSNNTTLIAFATSRPPVNDQKVRRAISYAINRQALVDVVLKGYGVVAHDPFPPYHWAHDPSIKAEYNPEKAKALLREAGYSASNPLKFTLVTINQPLYQDQAQLIKQMLEDVGIDMNILPLEYTAVSAMTGGPHKDWQGHAALYRITPLRSTAFEFTAYQFYSQGALNRSWYNKNDGFKNPRVDQLMAESMKYGDFTEAERVKAKPLYQEISKAIIEDAPQILLNFWNNADIVSKKVHGYEVREVDVTPFTDVWLSK